MRKLLGILMAGTVAVLGATGAMAQDKLKVGFVYVGPVDDFGWTYRHDQGRQAVESEFGDRVETTFVASVSEGPDAERVIRQLAESGNDLIFTTSFGFMNPTVKVARDFPNVKFEHATGFKRADNVSTYSARFYEGRAVIGAIAGRLTKTNVIGYIGAFPIPEVVRGINAFTLALQRVNPDAEVKVIWLNTWFNPGQEADAAKTLLDQGADILVQHTDSPAPLQVAAERGAFAFGQASDNAQFAPGAQLTAIVDNWNPYYVERVRAALDGTWESTDTWGGLDVGMVEMAPYASSLPDDVRAMAEEMEAKLISGEMHAFDGPINDQQGNEIVAAGEHMSDETLLTMDFYIEGVTGSLPN